MKIIDGKAIAQSIRGALKDEVNQLKQAGINPKLAVILVGDNPASEVYVRNKAKACEDIGVDFELFRMGKETTTDGLLKLIDNLNSDKNINGILLQHPCDAEVDELKAFERINPLKDVDGFNPINVGKLNIGQDCLVSCTPYGVLRMLKYENIDITGKNIVVVGRSNIVGKPMAALMLKENATVTICHSKTKGLKNFTKEADILIVAIGKANFVTEDMIKEGAVVIDVGMNRVDRKLCGDVDFENVKEKTSYITPVPGGVGPMTIAMLMENLIKATRMQK